MYLNRWSQNEQKAFFVLADKVMCIDDKVEDVELDMIHAYLQEIHKNEDFIQNLNLSEEQAGEIFMSASSSVQKEVYIELYALAVCNSEYAQVEKEYMNQLGEAWEISEAVRCKIQEHIDQLNKIYLSLEKIIMEE